MCCHPNAGLSDTLCSVIPMHELSDTVFCHANAGAVSLYVLSFQCRSSVTLCSVIPVQGLSITLCSVIPMQELSDTLCYVTQV